MSDEAVARVAEMGHSAPDGHNPRPARLLKSCRSPWCVRYGRKLPLSPQRLMWGYVVAAASADDLETIALCNLVVISIGKRDLEPSSAILVGRRP